MKKGFKFLFVALIAVLCTVASIPTLAQNPSAVDDITVVDKATADSGTVITVPADAVTVDSSVTEAPGEVVEETEASTASAIWAWIAANWYIVLPALYEFIIRVVPTAKDWSWLNLIKKLLDFLLPNLATKSTAKATHK